jgi:nucleotide-binding universal stress UspA family protein
VAESENKSDVRGRIVVGIDGSSGSLLALEWAARQAELTGASLAVVAVWEWPTALGWSVIPEGFNPAADAQNMLEPILSSLRSLHPHMALEYKIVEGHPAPVLVSESRNAELVVVGSRGHGEFVGMLIGSTSEHCTANAACPVVVVRDNTSHA